MRRFYAAVIVVIALAALFGCGNATVADEATGGYIPGQVEDAYGFTHGAYVGRATVKVLDDGSVDVTLDEAFLPHTLAVVDMEAAEWTEGNTVSYMSHGDELRVAKYVEYDGTVYVGTSLGTGIFYVEAGDNGEPAGGTDLDLIIIRNQASMAAYYTNLAAGAFKVFTEFGGDAIPVTTTSYGGLTKKSSPGYWNFGQTWAGNIAAIETFIEENGAAFSLSEMKRATEEDKDGLKKWSVADAVTGATNSDFKDYFGLAQMAFGRLKMQ